MINWTYTRRWLGLALVLGGAGLVIVLISARWYGNDEKTQRTLLLSLLVLLGLGSVLRLLADREGRPAQGDGWLYLWLALAFPLYLAAMYLRPLGYFFALTPLHLAQWALVLAVAGPAFLLTLLRLPRRKGATA